MVFCGVLDYERLSFGCVTCVMGGILLDIISSCVQGNLEMGNLVDWEIWCFRDLDICWASRT